MTTRNRAKTIRHQTRACSERMMAYRRASDGDRTNISRSDDGLSFSERHQNVARCEVDRQDDTTRDIKMNRPNEERMRTIFMSSDNGNCEGRMTEQHTIRGHEYYRALAR